MGRAMNGAVETSSLIDFDHADDVALFAELIALLQSTLEIFYQNAASLGLQVNWAKTKIQSLSDFLPQPDPLMIEGQIVGVVDTGQLCFSWIFGHTSCRSSPEIRRQIGIAKQTFNDLERGVWRSRLTLATMLRIYKSNAPSIMDRVLSCSLHHLTDSTNSIWAVWARGSEYNYSHHVRE